MYTVIMIVLVVLLSILLLLYYLYDCNDITSYVLQSIRSCLLRMPSPSPRALFLCIMFKQLMIFIVLLQI